MDNNSIEKLIDEKMEALSIRLQFCFQNELQKALDNLRGVHDGVDIDGIKCLRSSSVCSLLDISERTLSRRRKENKIGFIYRNGTYWYKVEDLLRYIDGDYVAAIKEKEAKRGPRGTLAQFFN